MDIIPTIFAKNKKQFDLKLKKLISASKELQIDIMDGKFVKAKSVNPKYIPTLFIYQKIFEAHLMVKEPQKYIDEFAKKGFGRIIFHYETIKDHKKITQIARNIRKHGMHAILAINPRTSVKKIKELLPYFHTIMLMGVTPGKEGQKLIPATYKKIRDIKKNRPNIKVQIDGGVNKTTAKKLKEAGADILNTGSLTAKSKDPEKTIQELQKA